VVYPTRPIRATTLPDQKVRATWYLDPLEVFRSIARPNLRLSFFCFVNLPKKCI